MARSTTTRFLIATTLIAGTTAVALAAFDQPPVPATSPAAPTAPAAQPVGGGGKPKPMVLPKTVSAMMADRIARKLIEASPVADPADTKARDAAAEKLANCEELLTASQGQILWGGFNPRQGYDPDAYRLTELSNDDFFQLTEFVPVVWAKLYLSTFMFPGPYEVRQEGKFTVLEMDTQFRADMPPGEYPYPFWHSPNKWTAYVKVEKLLLVFTTDKLIASMRKSPDPVSLKQVRKPWDTKWLWTDEQGNPQPRVTLYNYLFSKDNPHVEGLEKSYRALEKEFRTNDCMQCHEPDNRSRINDLLLLNYPNQALVMRRTLVAVLESNSMPPGNVIAHEPTGIQKPEVLAELIKLAKDFEREADRAFAYEETHKKAAAKPAP